QASSRRRTPREQAQSSSPSRETRQRAAPADRSRERCRGSLRSSDQSRTPVDDGVHGEPCACEQIPDDAIDVNAHALHFRVTASYQENNQDQSKAHIANNV